MTPCRAAWLPHTRKGQSLHALLVQVLLVVIPCVCALPGQAEVDESAPVTSDIPEPTASPFPAGSGRKSPAAVAIVRVVQGEVELSLSAPVELSRDYLRGSAERAERCYVDLFPASFSSRGRSVFELPAGSIRKVRISQFRAGVVRVVLDLRGSHQCAVTNLTNPQRLLVSVNEMQGLSKDASPSFPKEKDTIIQPAPPRNEVRHGQALDRRPTPVETTQQQEQEKSEESLPSVAWRTETLPWTMPKPMPAVRLSEGSNTVAPAFTSSSEATGQGDVPGEIKIMEPSRTQFPEPQTMKVPEFQGPVLFSQNLTREPNRIGGGMIVQQFWMIVTGASVVVAFLAGGGVVFLWNSRNRQAPPEKSDGWEARMAYLEEAVNRAGMLNSSFFHSLEITQKRLEALLTQADLTEQNLRRLLHQSALSGEQLTGRSGDSYSTATMLLAEGEDVQQVARVLKLPVAQVRFLQELRRSTQGEKAADPQEKVAEVQHGRSLAAGLKNFVTQLNGAPDDGTPLAQNGQPL